MKTSDVAVTVAAMVIGLSGLATAISQDKIPELPKQRPAEAKSTTVTGCVAQGATTDAYVLTNVMRDLQATAKDASKPETLRLSGTEVDMSKHLGHKVALTGADVVGVPGMGAGTTTTGAKVPAAFTVTSLKMVSASCAEVGD